MDSPALNTDRELWREVEGDYYAPSIFVTERGGIGIDVGGSVYVKPIREWHALAGGPFPGIASANATEAPANSQVVAEAIEPQTAPVLKESNR